MSFKITLHIGCFDWEQSPDGFIARSLTASEVDAAIVRSEVDCSGTVTRPSRSSPPSPG